MVLTQIATQALQNQIIHQVDYTALFTGVVQIFVTSGLVFWVYKVKDKQYEILSKYYEKKFTDAADDIATLKREVADLKLSENKWFKNFWALYNIIQSGSSCVSVRNCKIKKAFDAYNEKDGSVV